MIFNSYQFLIFFPIVTILYYVIPQKFKYIWLLICSYFFYMCWNAKYALLMLFSTAVTYTGGLLIEYFKGTNWNEQKKIRFKKLAVFFSFMLNLLVLGYFKYTSFGLHLLAYMFRLVNIELSIPVFDIVLPVGISFYTFQALSYIMDVYRDEIYAEKNFLRYALFVSFFPQLVAGPIERSKNLLKQLAGNKEFCIHTVVHGFWLMLWGYFLKVVLADRAAIFVNTVYNDYTAFEGYFLIVATILFAVQIYCDFYGYSIIAMGAAKILGIDLMENFRAPYLSHTVAEFWRDWHISLTSWFKDYLYIPLGGSKKGRIRKYINKIIVFLISGLWHGAGMSYVIWGLLNGIYQVVGEILNPVKKKIRDLLHINRKNLLYKLARISCTFVLVDFAWIFFRADNVRSALEISKGIIKEIISIDGSFITKMFHGSVLTKGGLNEKNLVVLLICICILIFADICKRKGISISKKFQNLPWWEQSLCSVFVICVILIFGIWGPEYDQASFIYFQF